MKYRLHQLLYSVGVCTSIYRPEIIRNVQYGGSLQRGHWPIIGLGWKEDPQRLKGFVGERNLRITQTTSFLLLQLPNCRMRLLKSPETIMSTKHPQSSSTMLPSAGTRLSWLILILKIAAAIVTVKIIGTLIQKKNFNSLYQLQHLLPPFFNTSSMKRPYFNLSEDTTLNFFHFHKTGGTAIKFALFAAYLRLTKSKTGQLVKVRGSCYERSSSEFGEGEGKGRSAFVCDWNPVAAMTETQRCEIDLSIGHQFMKDGIIKLLPKRTVKSFTVLRHPVDRKISAYYHFMVRQQKKNESQVKMNDIRDFLIFEKGDKGNGVKCDVGPNYIAGRLLTNGFSKYYGRTRDESTQKRLIRHIWFDVPKENRNDIIEKGMAVIKKFLVVGMQHEQPATKCMIGKLLRAFDGALGIEGDGAGRFEEALSTWNAGQYSLKGRDVWNSLSQSDRELVKQREYIDLKLFESGLKLFHQQAVSLGCDHLLTGDDVLPNVV